MNAYLKTAIIAVVAVAVVVRVPQLKSAIFGA